MSYAARFRLSLGRLAAAIFLSIVLTTLILLVSGAPPLHTFTILFAGGIGSWAKLAQTVGVWIPLVLCCSALLLTFAPGLWNIGIEGQVILGAIFATGFLRPFPTGASPLVLAGALIAGMIGGALWAYIAGVLKTWGRVHEIFWGVGVEFCGPGSHPLAYIRAMEKTGRCFHERHRTAASLFLAQRYKWFFLESGEPDPGTAGHFPGDLSSSFYSLGIKFESSWSESRGGFALWSQTKQADCGSDGYLWGSGRTGWSATSGGCVPSVVAGNLQ